MLPPLRYAPVSTPLGRLHVAYGGKAVCCVGLGSDGRRFERACARAFGVRPIRDSRLPRDLGKQVLDHLTGRRRFTGRIDLSCLTPFQRRVLQKIRTIPAGEVRSYRWVAKAIGAERAVRAVGTALAKNPVPLLIPCHRVIRSDGRLGEYSGGGPSVKAKLLAFEGADLEGLIRLPG
ncbi:MAG: methylated-DNA--[protein]-cysteine S-methyltransferase, partial [candidate division NC10 bacterium]|nr:methylated-DNA--[protein]-cysteine S-methyltransferase [candidate division NC10 bacterium]